MKARVEAQHGLIEGARRFSRQEQGTQLVELAIVLPIMLTLFAATAEFGRYFYTYTTLAKATRAGVRYLITEPVDANKVNTAKDAEAKRLVIYGDMSVSTTSKPVISGLNSNNVTIIRSGGSGGTPPTVTIRIDSFTYQPLFDLSKFCGTAWLNVPVRPSTTMR